MDGLAAAVAMLPPGMRIGTNRLSMEERGRAGEFRLRRGRKPTVLLGETEVALPGCGAVSAEELQWVIDAACRSSPYAFAAALAQGYIPGAGGVRIGVCGQLRGGESGEGIMGAVTSLALRVPRQVKGCARELVGGEFVSTLILSPPGLGKTTLLRDMVRLLSDGGCRVGLCDERGEVAAFSQGEPGFDVGLCTDVMTGAKKAQGAMMLLRAMNPRILAMDEITAAEDVEACCCAANCGVKLLATAHGSGREDLRQRALYRQLLDAGIFRRLIRIELLNGRRNYREETL